MKNIAEISALDQNEVVAIPYPYQLGWSSVVLPQSV